MPTHSSTFPSLILFLASASLTVLGGCAHAVGSQLVAARSAMDQARGDGTGELEPRSLESAARLLDVAEARDDGSDEEAHYAYLAEREVRTAMADARRERLEQQAARDMQLLARTRSGVITIAASVLFDTGSAELTEAGRGHLSPIAEGLAATDQLAVVAGFTDAQGDEDLNRGLSERRADAVRRFLVERGVAQARVLAQGLGEAYPVADNGTETGRAQNRRVEISLFDTAADAGDRAPAVATR